VSAGRTILSLQFWKRPVDLVYLVQFLGFNSAGIVQAARFRPSTDAFLDAFFLLVNTGSGVRYWRPFSELNAPLGCMTSFYIIQAVPMRQPMLNREFSNKFLPESFRGPVWSLHCRMSLTRPTFSIINSMEHRAETKSKVIV